MSIGWLCCWYCKSIGFFFLSLSLAYWSPQWASSENVLALLCCCYLIWLCLFPSQITIELNNMPWMANANVNPSQSEGFDQFSLSQLTEVLSLDRFFVDFLSCVESSRFSHIDNYTGWLAFLCHSHNDIHKRPRVLKIFADLIQWESFFFRQHWLIMLSLWHSNQWAGCDVALIYLFTYLPDICVQRNEWKYFARVTKGWMSSNSDENSLSQAFLVLSMIPTNVLVNHLFGYGFTSKIELCPYVIIPTIDYALVATRSVPIEIL